MAVSQSQRILDLARAGHDVAYIGTMLQASYGQIVSALQDLSIDGVSQEQRILDLVQGGQRAESVARWMNVPIATVWFALQDLANSGNSPDFQLPSSVVSVSGERSVFAFNGATDGTQINAALTALGGPGTVWLPAGTAIIDTPVVLGNGQRLIGQGHEDEQTVLQAKSGLNDNVIETASFHTWQGTGYLYGVYGAEIHDLVVDGNGTNQSSGGLTGAMTGLSAWAGSTGYTANQLVTYGGAVYACAVAHTSASTFAADSYKWTCMGAGGCGIALYGYRNSCTRVTVRNCWGDGFYSEDSSHFGLDEYCGEEGCEQWLREFKIYNNGVNALGNAAGIRWLGPHDCMVETGLVWDNNNTGVYTGAHPGGFLLSHVHVWGSASPYNQQYSFDSGTDFTAIGCVFEIAPIQGSRGVRCVRNGQKIYISGCDFLDWWYPFMGQYPSGNIGLEINDSWGLGGHYIDAFFSGCVNGAVYIGNDGGYSLIKGLVQNQYGPAVTSHVTTVAAGSNGVNVNTFAGSGVLNVATTNPGAGTVTAFPSAGVVCVGTYSIPSPPAGQTNCGLAVISYTGKTGTSFTGCTLLTAQGVSTGTIATGDTVSSMMMVANKACSDLANRAITTKIDLRAAGGTTGTDTDVDTGRNMTTASPLLSPSATGGVYGASTYVWPWEGQGRLILDYVSIGGAGTYNSETVTMQMTAYLSDGTTKTATQNVTTAVQFFEFYNYQLGQLVAKTDCVIKAVGFACKSTISNSLAQVQIYFAGHS